MLLTVPVGSGYLTLQGIRYLRLGMHGSLTREELIEQIRESKELKDLDLSEVDVSGIDFSDCCLEQVCFSKEGQADRELKDLKFHNVQLKSVSFDGAVMMNCDFDSVGKEGSSLLQQVSFCKCVMVSCRFRKAQLKWTDLRYAEINKATFEEAQLSYCDLYKCFFEGIIIFRKSQLEYCSLYNTYFGDGATLRRENLVKGRLLQEDKQEYRVFLEDWHKMGTGERKNDQGGKSDWSPDKSLAARHADAEDVYKTLNGLWMSKGFLSDANWAYVQGRKLELRRMVSELFSGELGTGDRFLYPFYILWNFITGQLFGYGESIVRMVSTYVVMVFLFAFFYYNLKDVSLINYTQALCVSLQNMVAMGPDEVSGISPMVDFLNVIQTTAGILITGIFGFILGNKIRNQ